jgi:para-aminobenzoate synthetase component I
LNYILTTTTLTNCTFNISDFDEMKQKVLNWTKQFNTFCFLDNHQYQIEPHAVECLLAAGVKRQLCAEAGNALEQLHMFITPRSDRDGQTRSWLFGHLGYDLKNEIEKLSSSHPDRIQSSGSMKIK